MARSIGSTFLSQLNSSEIRPFYAIKMYFSSGTLLLNTTYNDRVNSGIEGDTLSGSVKFDFILQESTDDSTFTAVTSSTSVTEGSVDSNGIFLTLDANGETPQTSAIGYIGGSRYVRVKIDATGTHSNGTPISVQGILGNPVDSTDA